MEKRMAVDLERSAPTARVIDGRAVAATVTARVKERVAALGYQPGLAVILVGDDAASTVYVKRKDAAALAAGIAARTARLPADTSQEELLSLVTELNRDDAVDGILIQLPLPKQINSDAVLAAIDPAKDVDGFHPVNAGALAIGRPRLVPCTPAGIVKLLEVSGVTLSGARAVVVGRSAIVGRPVAALLTSADATVTLAHSRTRDLPAECRRADVLVAAVGQPEMVREGWIRPGAVVIDVGINRLPDGRLVGDVAYAECAAVAGAITPVPGGVGPMTIACLLENTVTAALRRRRQTDGKIPADFRPAAMTS
jgi:methylenetetrahydrofolate dehydrogenase (NADP+)/methenyltetrahydrofolate cyclohydrolase